MLRYWGMKSKEMLRNQDIMMMKRKEKNGRRKQVRRRIWGRRQTAEMVAQALRPHSSLTMLLRPGCKSCKPFKPSTTIFRTISSMRSARLMELFLDKCGAFQRSTKAWFAKLKLKSRFNNLLTKFMQKTASSSPSQKLSETKVSMRIWRIGQNPSRLNITSLLSTEKQSAADG